MLTSLSDLMYDTKNNIVLMRRMAEIVSQGLSPLPRAGNNSELIISLTSYGERLKTVHYTIMSMIAQDVQPNRIILYLDNETPHESITTELRRVASEMLV